MLGINKEEDISNIKIIDTHPERVRPLVLGEGIPVAIREGIWSGETAFITREGKEIPVSQVILSHQSSVGEIQYLSTIARDIAEQKEEERRMAIRNALLELFAKKTSRRDYLDAVVDLLQKWSQCRCVGIRVLDSHGNIPYEAYVGFSHEFWELENWLSIRDRQCTCSRVILGEIDPQEVNVVTPGGSFCCGNTVCFIENLSEAEKSRYRGICIQSGFLSVAIIPIRYREKIIGAIHLADEMENKVSFKTLEFIESLTPIIGEAVIRFNLEEELKESEGRLRFLSSELLRVQENERKRIAREIHDGIGQTLAAIKFSLESKLSQAGNVVAPQGSTLESIISLTQSGIDEARRIQMDLHPSVLDDLGILATLAWFTREYQKVYSHIRIERKTTLNEEDVPDPLKIVLYRIIQEALNNVAKHSKANLVNLSLTKSEGRIELMIEDNGMGFDLENYRKGLGLTSMRERAELSGGSFTIESTQQEGTTIRANWPL
jgi:signal transduction histidine kinase